MGIEEYKAYTRQLENDVGKWHHAYDALMVERNQLVNRIRELETENKKLKGETKYAAVLAGNSKAHFKQAVKLDNELKGLIDNDAKEKI